MDIFIEYMVKRKMPVTVRILNIVCWFFGIIIALVILFLRQPILGGLNALLSAAVIYVLWRFTSSGNLEFEYALTNGEFEVDKIIAQKRRKNIISIRCSEIEIMAPVNSSEYETRKNNKIYEKLIDVSSGLSSENLYFADFFYKGQRVRMLFEPNEKMKLNMKNFNPRNINL